jgi:hypothetical protein
MTPPKVGFHLRATDPIRETVHHRIWPASGHAVYGMVSNAIRDRCCCERFSLRSEMTGRKGRRFVGLESVVRIAISESSCTPTGPQLLYMLQGITHVRRARAVLK